MPMPKQSLEQDPCSNNNHSNTDILNISDLKIIEESFSIEWNSKVDQIAFAHLTLED